MPHGTPDWGLVGPKATVFGLDDLGELAVRLASPNTWDRRGDEIYSADFRNGLELFVPGTSGLGAAVNLFAGHTRHGAFSVALTAGSNLSRYARIVALLPFPVLSRVGAEWSFSVAALTENTHIEIHWETLTDEWRAVVRIRRLTNDVQYQDRLGAWQTLPGNVSCNTSNYPENTAKLVVDLNLQEYVRFVVNDTIFPMIALQARRVGAGTVPAYGVWIYHYGLATFNPVQYVDSVIITQNEP